MPPVILNVRCGFFIRQWKSTQQVTIFYFFIDDNYRLFYTPQHVVLQIAAKSSQTAEEMSQKLMQQNVPTLSVYQAKLSQIKKFEYTDQMHFPHQNCFDVQLAPKQALKSILAFSLYDDDCADLYAFLQQYDAHVKAVRAATGGSGGGAQAASAQSSTGATTPLEHMFSWIAKTARERTGNRDTSALTPLQHVTGDLVHQENATGAQKAPSAPVDSHAAEQRNKQVEVLNEKDGVVFSGRMLNGVPHGQCTEFYNKEGISFIGEFRNGRKQGLGYYVNSNLDTVYCEFIDD